MAELHAKQLVRTIARAFYDDEAIVVLDALCREPYLIDHEQAGRGPLEDKFGIQAKQVRRVLQALHDDCLVEKYVRNYRDPRAPKGTRKKKRTFWYINYLHFVKLVRLRLFFMDKIISEEAEKRMTEEAMYHCDLCGSDYDLLTAFHNQRDDQFFCEKCYREDDQVIFLVERGGPEAAAKTGGGSRSQNLKHKKDEQMAEVPGLRDGVMEILHRINTFPIPPPTNLPVDHIENAMQDFKEEQDRIADEANDPDAAHRSSAGGGGGHQHTAFVNESGQSVQVKIFSGANSSPSQTAEHAAATDYSQGALPAWMTRDVTGKISSNAIQDAQERAAKRQKLTGAVTANKDALSRGGASALLQAKTQPKPTPAAAPAARAAPVDHDKLAYEASTYVMVDGQQKRLKDITKADEDNMSAEEYAAFAQARRGAGGDANDDEDDEDDEDDFM
mmetsp:Transcript_2851/g.7111  ORF Transcript_2851/g.7111 Transcript_2851/m.7111 type:complete len:445 (-) Transcript_2851:140-1474(-)